ncbi:MAG TPA: DNA polymerase IV [Methyloceanibacter sp.]|nr:DNA polymerase IV [Methyloceanibacter sp.]
MSRAHGDWPRIVAHADMDAFYASVEQLDDPSLRGKPLLIGSPSPRGVVLTASYEARPYGVGSAMPMVKARRLCPDAVVVRPRFERYQEISAAIMRAFGEFSPEVEPLSLDEAFIDMTGSERLFGDPRAMGLRLKEAVRAATGGLSASVGISATKYVAKVASAHQKPDGLTVVPPETAKAWLAPLPVSRLWGAGQKTEPRLLALGLRTIGDVADADPRLLADKLGRLGLHFHTLAQAKDPRRVEGHRRSKSIGSENTLARDVRDKGEIKLHLRRSADKIARRLRTKGFVASGVGVKLKTADFKILTRQHHLPEPTDVAEQLYSVGVALLDAFNHKGPFRLVGMTAYDLAQTGGATQTALFDTFGRRRQLEVAIDTLAARFGGNVVQRGEELDARGGLTLTPNLDFLEEGPPEGDD